MKTTQLYAEITARSITPQVMNWLNDLEERFGEERVCAMLEVEGAKGNHGKLLGRVRTRLAEIDAAHRPGATPHELDHDTLMAMVRGQIPEPPRPFIYDTRDLTADEYTELLAWTMRAQRGAIVGVPA